MKLISSIGIDIPSNADKYIPINSINSLSETDIAVLLPSFVYTDYSTYNPSGTGQYEGKKLYNKESSAKIKEHASHWKNEVSHFLGNGGTLFIILSKKEDFCIYTGTKSFSGTGRNQQTTNHVTDYTNYNFLPSFEVDCFSATGKEVFPVSPLVADLYKNCKDHLSFETYIKGEKLTNPIFRTKNKDRILGATLNVQKGFVVFIPYISFDDTKYTKYNSKTDKTTWTPEAIRVGTIFLNALAEIDKAMRKSSDKTPKPIWLKDSSFNLESSEKTGQQIEKLKSDIEKKKNEISTLEKKYEEEDSLKELLYETGKLLENAVIKALKILGYKAENYDDGVLELDQIILSPEGERFIGECEGKDNKDIDISKFRQLLDGLNADYERDEVLEKAYGLLFGNPQRLTKPNERTLSFTQKCMLGAKRENIGLILTSDLFSVCRHIIENKDTVYATKCRAAIKKQLGQIIKFPAL